MAVNARTINLEYNDNWLEELNNRYSSLSPEQRNTYHQLRPLLKELDKHSVDNPAQQESSWKEFHERVEGIAGYVDSGRESLSKYIEITKDEFGAYKNLYINTLHEHGNLRSPQFYLQREALAQRLGFLTRGWLHDLILSETNPNTPLHKQLGLNTKSLEHQWSLKGESGLKFKDFAKHEARLINYTKHLEMGGTILLILDGILGLLDTSMTYLSGAGFRATARTFIVDATQIGSGAWGSARGAKVGAAVGRVAGAVVGGAVGLILGVVGGCLVGEIIFPLGGGIPGAMAGGIEGALEGSMAGGYIGNIIGAGIGLYIGGTEASKYTGTAVGKYYDRIVHVALPINKGGK